MHPHGKADFPHAWNATSTLMLHGIVHAHGVLLRITLQY